MGLAPYGRPGQIEPLLEIKNNILKVREWGEDFNQPWISESGHDWEKCSSMNHWKDIAWRVQEDTEVVLLHRAAWLRETTSTKIFALQEVSA